MTARTKLGITIAVSLLAAFLSYYIPGRRMPLDFHAMLVFSIPFATVWSLLFVAAIWRLGRLGFWLVIGAPMALWWPVWMLFNHFPSCYYLHNCV